MTTLLSAASRLSHDVLRHTAGGLQAAVFSGVRWGTPGEPYPEDIDITRRVEHVRGGLPRGSVVDRFYTSLRDIAQRNIDRAVTDDLDKH